MKEKISLKKAYSSLLTETHLSQLKVEGSIPSWLSGCFLSNGPAQFEVGNTSFKHWLDGFAMLKGFTFNEGKVHFENKFIHSQQYTESLLKKKLAYNEFATYADKSWLMRSIHSIQSILKKEIYDNCNVNTCKVGNQYIAMTESNHQIEFELDTLITKGPFQNNLQGQLALAHPQLDILSGDLINITTEIGKNIKYHVYQISPESKPQLISTYSCNALFYMHSFCLTENYIVLLKSPLRINQLKLLLGCPFNNTLAWKRNENSHFILIHRITGTINTIEVDPFIFLHSANAFEQENELILDLVCYEKKENPYHLLYLNNLSSKKPKFTSTFLKRYTLNFLTTKITQTLLSKGILEFPQINYDFYNGKPYKYVYSTLMTSKEQLFFNAIQKTNVMTGEEKIWVKEGYYPGEPLFVPYPQARGEDEGVLLFIAFNAETSCSSLMILDACDFKLQGEIFLPFHLPLGLHGQFYPTL